MTACDAAAARRVAERLAEVRRLVEVDLVVRAAAVRRLEGWSGRHREDLDGQRAALERALAGAADGLGHDIARLEAVAELAAAAAGRRGPR